MEPESVPPQGEAPAVVAPPVEAPASPASASQPSEPSPRSEASTSPPSEPQPALPSEKEGDESGLGTLLVLAVGALLLPLALLFLRKRGSGGSPSQGPFDNSYDP
jgi:uncharacterized membrane protein